MELVLDKIGKKFGPDWIFKSIDYKFYQGQSYAITGHNGSGKSTLLQIILGTVIPTRGKVIYPFPKDKIHKHVSFVSPYQNIPLDLTLKELIQIHDGAKGFIKEVNEYEFLEKANLKKKAKTKLSEFSSGMLQRVKLGLAFYTVGDLLLLDEPTISLDKENKDWYLDEIQLLQKSFDLPMPFQ